MADRLAETVADGVRSRFHRALEARKHADESVEAGRRFVAAYVDLTHYVEAVDTLAAGREGGHGGGAQAGHGHGE